MYRILSLLILLLFPACGGDNTEVSDGVSSYLSGRLTVRAEVDSIPDYRDFEVLVATSDSIDVDTLGYAITDSMGVFSMEVIAADRGVYPLIISRRGVVLKVDELVVAPGDSATVEAVFPVPSRPLRIRSQENGAWAAYRNAKAQYNNTLVEQLQAGTYNETTAEANIRQTVAILWSLRETYPGTVGSDLAAAEAIAMLSGWHDSLAVAYAREIEPGNPSYAQVARVARRAEARKAGQAAALRVLQSFAEMALDDDARAAIASEVVLAHMDSLEREEALAAARTLALEHPDSEWAAWAEQATYELENLMPGMAAPTFDVVNNRGTPISLSDLRGTVVLLEFYVPRNAAYQRELDARNALYEAARGLPFTLLSISLQPDEAINEAFLQGRDVPGIHVFAPVVDTTGVNIAQRYNVNTLPTRYLIDREGKIVGKYTGNAMTILQRDALALLDQHGM